ATPGMAPFRRSSSPPAYAPNAALRSTTVFPSPPLKALHWPSAATCIISTGGSTSTPAKTSYESRDREDVNSFRTQSMELETFDAIVVGSGVAGGAAAQQLCQVGLRVLVLESGGTLQSENEEPAFSNISDYQVQKRCYAFS